MGDVVDFKRDGDKASSPNVIDMLVNQLNEIAKQDNVTGIMVALMTDKREIISGFFNTSFQDEAVMEKTLSYDIFMRRQARDADEEI